MSDKIPLSGMFCATCGLQESTAAWDASADGNCPECKALWPNALQVRFPADGGPMPHAWQPRPEPSSPTLTARFPFEPGQQVWVVAKDTVVVNETPCPTCDGTGRVGPPGAPTRLPCPGGRPSPHADKMVCHSGKLQGTSQQWGVHPGVVRVVYASWYSVRSNGAAPDYRTTCLLAWKNSSGKEEILEGYSPNTSREGRPYACPTGGMALRIARERNYSDEEE